MLWCAELPAEAHEALVGAAFASLPVYTQRSAQKAVLQCLDSSLAASSSFLKSFTAAVVR